GRTPRLNNRGGRDHWPGVWSGLLAGGGGCGGGGGGGGKTPRGGTQGGAGPPPPPGAAALHPRGGRPPKALPGPAGPRDAAGFGGAGQGVVLRGRERRKREAKDL